MTDETVTDDPADGVSTTPETDASESQQTESRETDPRRAEVCGDVVAVIPARGGSKGIPRKNVVPFLGAPLIAHTIDQSLRSERIDRTYVSTDDEEIASVAGDAGATVIDRPDDLAGDRSPTEDALLHALGVIRADGIDPDVVVLLQCTSPLRREGDIDSVVRLITDGEYDSALSCRRDHGFYWRTDSDADGGAEPINYDPSERAMRQELDPRYRENGSIYAVETSVLEREECRVGGDVGLHVMPKPLSLEIDTPEDLTLVEAIGREITFYSSFADV
ncbi:cytidylyltransferase domain-containing protein [Halorubrum sp. DTA46]|uniref:acylneuraminate cytidylyltransferase family protein n=1 Tax=Halorubrum sp. DTA46 TaxID=3402162 RepID=UPI003AAE7D69